MEIGSGILKISAKDMNLQTYMYTVSQKNHPDIFSCNLNKHYLSLIIFCTYIT